MLFTLALFGGALAAILAELLSHRDDDVRWDSLEMERWRNQGRDTKGGA